MWMDNMAKCSAMSISSYMKKIGGLLASAGSALVAYGVARLATVKRQPGTVSDGEGGTDPLYLAIIQHAYMLIFLGAILLATSVYCLARKRNSARGPSTRGRGPET
jgi:hypothetical protein